jgi:hypothetical protein
MTRDDKIIWAVVLTLYGLVALGWFLKGSGYWSGF